MQPGERTSCVGCHDNKNAAPPADRESYALKLGPQDITPWLGKPARGFSFVRDVQPVLDRHCVRCHKLDRGETSPEKLAAFSLKGTQTFDERSLRKWSTSYKALANPKYSKWVSPQSEPTVLPPYHAGATVSPLIEMLEEGHYQVKLSAEDMDRIVTWIDLSVPYCGDYREGLEGKHLAKYQHFLDKRIRWQAQEAKNIEQFIRDRQGPE